MKKNNLFKEISEELIKAESVLIFPHILMDGDAMGSAVAMCIALRNMGKKCNIVIEDKIADYLLFMEKGYCVKVNEVKEPADVSLCIDCGDEDRFPNRKDIFWKGKKTICVDHHRSSEGIADLNYVDPSAGATGELVYELLCEMNAEINLEMAECIFAAISSDTGNFMYSNATKKSHQITIDLIDIGLDCNKVYVALNENESIEKMMLQGKVMSEMEIFAEGKASVAVVSQKDLADVHALMEDTEGLVGKLRSLKGVEIGVLIKEKEKDVIKVSMRVKTHGDVATIAEKYNGGGHTKAAGCTIYDSLENAKEIIMKEITESLKNI